MPTRTLPKRMIEEEKKELKEFKRETHLYKLIVHMHRIKRGLLKQIEKDWTNTRLTSAYVKLCEEQINMLDRKVTVMEQEIAKSQNKLFGFEETLNDPILDKNIRVLMHNIRRGIIEEERYRNGLKVAIQQQISIISNPNLTGQDIINLRERGALNTEIIILTDNLQLLKKEKEVVKEEIKETKKLREGAGEIKARIIEVLRRSQYCVFSNSLDYERIPGFIKGFHLIVTSFEESKSEIENRLSRFATKARRYVGEDRGFSVRTGNIDINYDYLLLSFQNDVGDHAGRAAYTGVLIMYPKADGSFLKNCAENNLKDLIDIISRWIRRDKGITAGYLKRFIGHRIEAKAA